MFESWLKKNNIFITVVGIAFLCIVIGCAVYASFGHRVIEAMYEGRSVGFLNRIIEGQSVHSAEEFIKSADRKVFKLSAIFIIFTFLYFSIWWLLGYKQVRNVSKQSFKRLFLLLTYVIVAAVVLNTFMVK